MDLDERQFIGKKVPETDYRITEIIGRGRRGIVFKAHSDELNRDLAVKIVPLKNLIGKEKNPPTWKAEIEKANALRSDAVVKIESIIEWQEFGCIALLCEYVPDDNLKKYISKNKGKINVGFIIDLLKTLFDVLNEMDSKGIQHGDLHTKNILVEDRSFSLTPTNYAFRVTDFGVVSATGERGLIDDYENVAKVLKELLENVDYQGPGTSSMDKFTFNILNDEFLARHLLEIDTTRNPIARNSKAMYERLQEIDSEFKREEGAETVKMKTPFDLLSCEQVGDSHELLKSLYSDKFLGMSRIESNNNLVLTGPRGCGKSTVFKSLTACGKSRIRA
jgi:hypothetical protein